MGPAIPCCWFVLGVDCHTSAAHLDGLSGYEGRLIEYRSASVKDATDVAKHGLSLAEFVGFDAVPTVMTDDC